MNQAADRQLLEFAFNHLNQMGKVFMDSIDGIPDEELVHWVPAAVRANGDHVPTFSELAGRMQASGRWRLFNQIYGIPVDRPGVDTIRTNWTHTEIEELFTDWMSEFHRLLDTRPTPDLSAPPMNLEDTSMLWSRRDDLINLVERAAQQVGSAQTMSQVWKAEHGIHVSRPSE